LALPAGLKASGTWKPQRKSSGRAGAGKDAAKAQNAFAARGIHSAHLRRRAGSDKKYFLNIYKNNYQKNILLTKYILRNSSLTTLFFRLSAGSFTADINLAARGQSYLRATVSVQPDDNCPEPRSDSHCCGPMEPKMKNLLKFVKDESGATAIEYGLIAAGISVAIIAVVQGLGSKLNTTFTSVQTALK
jgi:pilus assembly protein Flp/PilA